MTTKRLQRMFRLLGRLGILLLGVCSLARADVKVLVVKSGDNSYFNQTVEQLINHTSSGVDFTIVTVGSDSPQPPSTDFDHVITLGRLAIKSVLQQMPGASALHSYLTEYEYHQISFPEGHYPLLLDQPLERYLQFLKQLMPDTKVGVIRTESSRITYQRLALSQQNHGIQLDQRIFSTEDNPVQLVRLALRSNDLLLALPEPEVFNRTTLKGTLLASYRLNKPLVSYSPSHVKSGALAAIFTSPQQIGSQLAGLLQKLLLKKTADLTKPEYANQFEISINRQVAHSLGLQLETDEDILHGMQDGASQ